MKKLFSAAAVLAVVAASARPACAEADGPDFYRLKQGSAALRYSPSADSPVIMTLAPGATCLRNFGCRGGLSLEEFTTLSAAEHERREERNPRWCKVELAGRFGWVEGRLLAEGACTAPKASAPSFDCRKVKKGTIEDQVCGDPELSALDRRMAIVYAEALRKSAHEKPPMLKILQGGWVKGRNDCWKETDRRACIKDAYVRWSVELEARYRLVPHAGPSRFACGTDKADELVVTRFTTDPPTLIAVRGKEDSLMFRDGTAKVGVASWTGRNESIREQVGGSLKVTWGYQAPEITCVPLK